MKKNILVLLFVAAALMACGKKTDTTGEVNTATELSSSEAKKASDTNNLVDFCSQDHQCGFFDTSKKQFLVPPQFKSCYGFSDNGLA